MDLYRVRSHLIVKKNKQIWTNYPVEWHCSTPIKLTSPSSDKKGLRSAWARIPPNDPEKTHSYLSLLTKRKLGLTHIFMRRH